MMVSVFPARGGPATKMLYSRSLTPRPNSRAWTARSWATTFSFRGLTSRVVSNPRVSGSQTARKLSGFNSQRFGDMVSPHQGHYQQADRQWSEAAVLYQVLMQTQEICYIIY